ncbi:MAG: helix-turn-helix transcriptional regulator [Bdellovibrionota bacterium]
MTLAEFLKNKREDAGLSQSEVARKLGYSSPQFVSNWERGLSSPPISSAKELCRIYKVPMTGFFEIYLEESLRGVEKDLRKKFFGGTKRRA